MCVILTFPCVEILIKGLPVSVMILLIRFPATFLSAGVTGASEGLVSTSLRVARDGERVDWIK